MEFEGSRSGRPPVHVGGVGVWLILLGAGALMAVIGIFAALSAEKDDNNKTQVGLTLLGVGVVLALMGPA